MHFTGHKPASQTHPGPSSAEKQLFPSLASRHPSHQHASYRVLDRDRLDKKSSAPRSFPHASVPCPPLPIATFPLASMRRQRSTNAFLERRNSSGSTSSTGSLRRSVSGMKKLIPLRLLQSPLQRRETDLSSWLKSASSYNPANLPPPTEQEPESELVRETTEQNIPWMASKSGSFLHDLHPDRYRDLIPCYAEPRSPIIGRAYFSENNLCFKHTLPGTICDELCIVSDYKEEDSTDSQSQTSLADDDETFDRDLRASVETSPTSVVSSRFSELSIQCQGELSMAYGSHCGSVDSHEDQVEQYFHHWAHGESSRSSSPDSLNDEVFRACATPLAPARATMIVVPRSPVVPEFHEDLHASIPPRPSTPFRMQKKRTSSLADALPMTPVMTSYDVQTLKPQGKRRRPRPRLAPLNLDLIVPTPPMTPPEQLPRVERPITALIVPLTPSSQNLQPIFSAEVNTPDVLQALGDILSNFPKDMLFLDTPCIQTIRHLNAAQTSNFPTDASSPTTMNPEISSKPQPRRYRLRRSKSRGLFGGLRSRQVLEPTSLLPPSTVSSNQTASSSGLGFFHPNHALPNPNFRPFRTIFPGQDEWWYSLLYAHLLAYNFVLTPLTPSITPSTVSHPRPFTASNSSNQSLYINLDVSRPDIATARPSTALSVSTRQVSPPNRFNTSPKASRMLGLHLPTTPYLSGREAMLEEARMKLEDAVARVVDCMIGEGEERAERGFVRALVEVVRACEGLN